MPHLNRFFVFQWIGWSVFAGINIYITVLTGELSSILITVNLLLALMGLMLSSAFRKHIIEKGWHQFNLEKQLIHVAIGIVFLTFIYAICYYLLLFIFFRNKLALHTDLVSISGTIIAIFMLFVCWTSLYFAWHYIEKNRSSLIKRLQLESAMKDLEIKTLRSNLQPHFIFNSLNSIRALIDEDPNLAREAITKISTILRHSIAHQEATNTLRNEIQFVQDYLSLEKIRFEERLITKTELSPDTLDYHIPSMMLQTLVENAIKHGISSSEKGGYIYIKSSINNQQLILEITNSGTWQEEAKHPDSIGFGLSSTIQRLKHQYGEQSRLQIRHTDKEVIILIEIPLTNN